MKLQLNNDNNQGELESFPYYIDCALKVLDDVFVFKVPCSLSIGMLPGASVSVEEYKEIVSSPQNSKKQDVLVNKLPLEEFVSKLKDNNLVEIVRHENGTNEMMVYACVLLNGVKLVTEIIFDKTSNSVNLRLTGPTDIYANYFQHALSMIANL